MFYDLFENTTTIVFSVLITLILMVSLFLDKDGKRKRFIEYAPTLMTSLGILGTFWGVVLGLLDFDTINIDSSIPNLLSGLKTAFVSSIIGMLAAIIFNTIDAWRFADMRDEADAFQRSIDASILKQTDILLDIQQGLCGTEQSSLNSQLKELRLYISKHNEEFDEALSSKFDTFSNNVATVSSELIGESLRGIVNDFNNALFGQFGDNFKALDSSVIKLLEWQDSYKENLSLMQEQFNINTESMSRIAKDMTDVAVTITAIESSCKNIPETMDELKSIIITTQNQLGDLVFNLESFVLIRDQAMAAAPQIHEHIAAMGSMFTTSADKLQEILEESDHRLINNAERVNKIMDDGINQFGTEIHKGMDALRQIGKDLVKGNGEICEVLEKGAQDIGTELISANNKMRDALAQGAECINQELILSNDKFRNSLENGYQEFQRTAHDSVNVFNEAINKQFNNFEQGAEREINRELEQLGAALIQISQGFVSNYEKLVSSYETAMARQQKILDLMEKQS